MSDPCHTIVVGALIRNVEGGILLIRHPRRGWEFPQGRVEEGEDVCAALQREIMEEAGVKVLPGPLAAVWSKLSSPPAIIFNFLAIYLEGDLRVSDESVELGWFPPEKALAMVAHPVNRDRLKVLLEFSGQIFFLAYATDPYRMIPAAGPQA